MLLAEDLGGGTANHIAEVLAVIAERGWRPILVTRNNPLVHRLSPAVEVHLMRRAAWFDRFPLAQLLRLLEIRRIVRRRRPEIVHTYFFWSIVYGRLLKWIGDIPRLVENREDMGFNWSDRTYRVLRVSRALPDRVICVADAVKRVVLRHERLPVARTHVIRNGVPQRAEHAEHAERASARAAFGFDDHHVVVGMVANLPRAVKGGHRLLDAAGAIIAQCPEVRFLLVGIGAESAALAPELRARGLDGFVVGAGYRRDVETCYAAMDISVLTSSSEGLSITLLESMRSGLPIVATNVGGNAEVVRDGATGFLVPVDDGAAFVEQVVTLATDASLRRRMGDTGRARIAECFDIGAVARRYLELYEDVLGLAERVAKA